MKASWSTKSLFYLKMAIIVSFTVLIVLNHFSPIGDLDSTNSLKVLNGPSFENPLGTDSLGRNYLILCLHGAGNSITMGFISALLTVSVGVLIGVFFGIQGAMVQNLFLRFLDIWSSIPSFVLATVFAVTIQGFCHQHASPFMTILGALAFAHWMPVSRMAYQYTLFLMSELYVEVSRTVGATNKQILMMHFWPGFRSHLMTTLTLQIQANIVYEGFLSYVGLGIQAPQTSWGLLIKEGWNYLSDAPHLLLAPAAMLFLFLMFFENLSNAR